MRLQVADAVRMHAGERWAHSLGFPNQGANQMLLTILVIILALWVLGLIGGIGGALIHGLLILAAIVLIAQLASGRGNTTA
jgi:hypothetical protein